MARLGVVVAASSGVKKTDKIEEQLNPYGYLLFQRQAKEDIRPAIARTFMALAQENKVPMWVMSLVDLKVFQASAE